MRLLPQLQELRLVLYDMPVVAFLGPRRLTVRWLDGMCSIANYDRFPPSVCLKWLPTEQLMNRNTRRQAKQFSLERIKSPDHGSDALNVRVSFLIDCMLICRFSLVTKSYVEHLSIEAGISNEERPGR